MAARTGPLAAVAVKRLLPEGARPSGERTVTIRNLPICLPATLTVPSLAIDTWSSEVPAGTVMAGSTRAPVEFTRRPLRSSWKLPSRVRAVEPLGRRTWK